MDASTYISLLAVLISLIALRENRKNLQDEKHAEAITKFGLKDIEIISQIEECNSKIYTLKLLSEIRKTDLNDGFIKDFTDEMKVIYDAEQTYFRDLISYLSQRNNSKDWTKQLATRSVMAERHYYQQAKKLTDIKGYITHKIEETS